MKKKLFTLVFGLMAASFLHAAPPKGEVLDRPMEAVARTLQAKLPALASDGMCEAEREDNGWNFQFRLKASESGADEVQVMLRASGDSKSELRVQGVRIQNMLLTTRHNADPTLSKEWTEKIRKLIEEAG